MEIKFRCNKCGKEQESDKKQSNQNWKVYPANKKCKCGGTYEISYFTK